MGDIMAKNIVLIRFSSREGGNCAKIATYIRRFYQSCNVREYKIDRENVPACGSCDYECLKPDRRCPNTVGYLTEVMDGILTSDLTYFIVPNYCGFPSANYFAFNERSVGYFDGNEDLLEKYLAVRKRFIVVSNTQSDAIKETMQQQTDKDPEILYMKSKSYGKQSIAGDLMDSQAARADLQRFLERSVTC